MSSHKIAGPHLVYPVHTHDPREAAHNPSSVGEGKGQFKGARFHHGARSMTMGRAPSGRSSLRGAGGRGGLSARRALGNQGLTEIDCMHDESLHSVDESSSEQLIGRIKAAQQDHEQREGHEEGDGRQPARMFQMAAAHGTDRTGDDSGVATARGRDAMSTPLPSMRTVGDMVQFIHSCVQKDPTGKSLGQILRRINAAVLRKEIDVPVVSRVADARVLLVEAFGGGKSSMQNAAPSMRNMHLMLPLWLVNLGRNRTDEQQARSAARLSSQRAFFDMK